jgi:phage tail protein X
MGRYTNVLFTKKEELDSINKRRYYNSLIDPTINLSVNDIYVITTIGDRLDLLAYQYYGDATYWWMIAAANTNLRKDSLYLEPGMQLRIPANPQNILQLLQTENTNR